MYTKKIFICAFLFFVCYLILNYLSNETEAFGGGRGGGRRGGGGRGSRGVRGGAGQTPVVVVPPVQAGTVNPAQTVGNYTALTRVSQQQAGQSIYDTAKTPGDTAALQAQDQALHKVGGSRKRKRKRIRGGSWFVWGSRRGGKKSSRKSCKCKRGKNKRTKSRRH